MGEKRKAELADGIASATDWPSMLALCKRQFQHLYQPLRDTQVNDVPVIAADIALRARDAVAGPLAIEAVMAAARHKMAELRVAELEAEIERLRAAGERAMSKRESVEADLSVYDGRLVVSIDIGEQALTWMLENGEPEKIARQLWEHSEVRDWIVRLLAGEDWTVISSSLGNADYSARCQFIAAVKSNVDEERMRHAIHELAAAEAYVKEYWRVWHSLPNPYETYRGGEEEFSGKSWEEAQAWWRQHISERLGLVEMKP